MESSSRVSVPSDVCSSVRPEFFLETVHRISYEHNIHFSFGKKGGNGEEISSLAKLMPILVILCGNWPIFRHFQLSGFP